MLKVLSQLKCQLSNGLCYFVGVAHNKKFIQFIWLITTTMIIIIIFQANMIPFQNLRIIMLEYIYFISWKITERKKIYRMIQILNSEWHDIWQTLAAIALFVFVPILLTSNYATRWYNWYQFKNVHFMESYNIPRGYEKFGIPCPTTKSCFVTLLRYYQVCVYY